MSLENLNQKKDVNYYIGENGLTHQLDMSGITGDLGIQKLDEILEEVNNSNELSESDKAQLVEFIELEKSVYKK